MTIELLTRVHTALVRAEGFVTGELSHFRDEVLAEIQKIRAELAGHIEAQSTPDPVQAPVEPVVPVDPVVPGEPLPVGGGGGGSFRETV